MTASRNRVLLTGELKLWLLTTCASPNRPTEPGPQRPQPAPPSPSDGRAAGARQGASKDERDGCPQPPDDPSHASIIGHFSPQCLERPGELLDAIRRRDRQQGSRGGISPPRNRQQTEASPWFGTCSEYSFSGFAVSKGGRDADVTVTGNSCGSRCGTRKKHSTRTKMDAPNSATETSPAPPCCWRLSIRGR